MVQLYLIVCSTPNIHAVDPVGAAMPKKIWLNSKISKLWFQLRLLAHGELIHNLL
jgi:hypothetical protein